ncbi:MAG TPA: hypothetical protein DCM27_01985, partial [Rhodospirillaceae bacterium]|nr:hypothetical protein [Rhodospirillaceae bacterium]
MSHNTNMISYLLAGIERILARKGVDEDGQSFTGGLSDRHALRKTQHEALNAYRDFLTDDTTSEEHKK